MQRAVNGVEVLERSLGLNGVTSALGAETGVKALERKKEDSKVIDLSGLTLSSLPRSSNHSTHPIILYSSNHSTRPIMGGINNVP